MKRTNDYHVEVRLLSFAEQDELKANWPYQLVYKLNDKVMGYGYVSAYSMFDYINAFIDNGRMLGTK